MADNRKAVKEYRERLSALKRMEVAIGLPRGKADHIYVDENGKNPISIYEVGQIHEHGATESGIPQRSFINQPAEMHSEELFKFANSKVIDINNGLSAKNILALTGALMQGFIIKHIKSGGSGKWAPLKEETIKRKGSSAPLIHHGQLWQSITWDVRPKTK